MPHWPLEARSQVTNTFWPPRWSNLVLRQRGWNAVSLGGNLPFATLSAAIAQHQPRLFWAELFTHRQR